MAPLPSVFSAIDDLSISSLELDRRTSPANIARLSQRSNTEITATFAKRSDFRSPLEAYSSLHARDKPAAPPPPSGQDQSQHGGWVVDPNNINNKGILALFGLLSAGLVIASIWFFFWAKNGGFHFRKGDWEEYKSTVLRRKGPDGKTLSHATRTTKLGGGSIVASTNLDKDFVSIREKPGRAGVKSGKKKQGKKVSKNKDDEDVRAYRHEKPARVGGLNREADGSYHDYTGTDYSDIASTPQAHRSHKPAKGTPLTPRNFSYVPGTESTFSMHSDDSHRPLRASPAHNRHSNASTPTHTPTRSRQPSPTKKATPRHHTSSRTSMPGSYTEPIDFETRYMGSEAGTEQTKNTKTYFHPLPGLSQGGNGFRRGGGRRRDSLSDSEGETGTMQS